MMKKLSNICILIAVVLIAVAAYLLYQDSQMEQVAQSASDKAVEGICIELDDNQDDAQERTELDIDGNLYMGLLSIPTLGLELPVQSSWSYEKLKLSPCLYQSDPLAIIAHNYKAHFGNIKSLKEDDVVTLTYVNGEAQDYEVVLVTKIEETDMEAVINSEYDLTLVTCNYSDNTERILVRLNMK